MGQRYHTNSGSWLGAKSLHGSTHRARGMVVDSCTMVADEPLKDVARHAWESFVFGKIPESFGRCPNKHVFMLGRFKK